MNAKKGLDWFAESFGDAISDIREKLVEEPWFGRPSTPPTAPKDQSMAEAFGWTERGQSPPTTPQRGHDFDR